MQGTKYTTCTALVKVHWFHLAIWLDVEATSIKGDTLSNEGNINIILFGVALVVNGDASRLRRCTFSDSVQKIHAVINELLALDHSNLFYIWLTFNQLSHLLLHVIWSCY